MEKITEEIKQAPNWAIKREEKKDIVVASNGKVSFFCANCRQKIKFEQPLNLLKHLSSHSRELDEPKRLLIEEANEIRQEYLQNKKKRKENNLDKKGLFLKFGTPLNQQNVDHNHLSYLLRKSFDLKVKTTSTNTGFLMKCFKCRQEDKLFYSFEGKMFLCLDYKSCGWKGWSLLQLKEEWRRYKHTNK